LLSGSRDCGLDDGPCAGRRSTCTGGRSEAEDGGQDGFFVLREETRVAWRGKKPDAPLQGTIGAKRPFTARRYRPSSEAQHLRDRVRQTDDRSRHRLHDNGFLQAARSKAEAVKQTDQTGRDQGRDDFCLSEVVSRRHDKACEMDGRTQNLAPDELAATMPPLRGESASPGLVIRSILAVAAARGRSRRVAPLLTPACTDPRRSCAHERDATLNRRRAAFPLSPDQAILGHRPHGQEELQLPRQITIIADDRRARAVHNTVGSFQPAWLRYRKNPPETVCSVARVLRQ